MFSFALYLSCYTSENSIHEHSTCFAEHSCILFLPSPSPVAIVVVVIYSSPIHSIRIRLWTDDILNIVFQSLKICWCLSFFFFNSCKTNLSLARIVSFFLLPCCYILDSNWHSFRMFSGRSVCKIDNDDLRDTWVFTSRTQPFSISRNWNSRTNGHLNRIPNRRHYLQLIIRKYFAVEQQQQTT